MSKNSGACQTFIANYVGRRLLVFATWIQKSTLVPTLCSRAFEYSSAECRCESVCLVHKTLFLIVFLVALSGSLAAPVALTRLLSCPCFAGAIVLARWLDHCIVGGTVVAPTVYLRIKPPLIAGSE